jgi:hypothetical protein
VGVTAANLLFDLTRVVIVTDDCGVRAALARVRAFLLEDARQVLGIFGAMGTILLLATGGVDHRHRWIGAGGVGAAGRAAVRAVAGGVLDCARVTV